MNPVITQHNISQVRREAERACRGNGTVDVPADAAPADGAAQQSQRLQQLLAQLDQLPDPQARALAAECVQALLHLHGDALERMLGLVSEAGPAAAPLQRQFLQDGVVRGLLLLHGLHPVDLETRLREALAKVEPYMKSHGGSVEILSLKDGVARLRLQGTCHGCPSSSATLELAIKQALEETCPDLLDLEVEGVVPLAAPRSALGVGVPRWKALDGFAPLREGEVRSLAVGGQSVIVCRAGGSLYAYRNECPACGLSLEGGVFKDATLRCRLGHRFEVRRAGLSPDNPEVQLQPFPLLAEGNTVKIAVRQ